MQLAMNRSSVTPFYGVRKNGIVLKFITEKKIRSIFWLIFKTKNDITLVTVLQFRQFQENNFTAFIEILDRVALYPNALSFCFFFPVLIVIQWFWTSDWKLIKYTCKVFLNIRTYEIPKIKHLCVYYFSSYFVPKSEIKQMQKLTPDFNTHWCTQKKNSPLRSKLRI